MPKVPISKDKSTSPKQLKLGGKQTKKNQPIKDGPGDGLDRHERFDAYKKANGLTGNALRAGMKRRGDDSLFSEDEIYDKPALRFVTLKELAQRDKNLQSAPLKAISTFSGCGGSSLGLRIAGFKVIAASEFIDVAAETYAANSDGFVWTKERAGDLTELAQRKGSPLTKEEKSAWIGFRQRMDMLSGTSPSDEEVKAGLKQGCIDGVSEAFLKTILPWWKDLPASTRKKLTGKWEDRWFDSLGMNEYLAVWAPMDREMAQAYKDSGKSTLIYGRDIRRLSATYLYEALGLKRGELDLIEGSPPCSGFSTSGLREAGWGKRKNYSDGVYQRVEDLFEQWCRLVDELRPRALVAENVPSIQAGSAKDGYFAPILSYLREIGYAATEAQVVEAHRHGVPQQRPRMFFQGYRDDVLDSGGNQIMPTWPEEKPFTYSWGDVVEYVGPQSESDKADADISNYKVGKVWATQTPGTRPKGSFYMNERLSLDLIPPTVTAAGASFLSISGLCHHEECRKLTIPEYKALFGFPPDFQFIGTYSERAERIGRSVCPPVMAALAGEIRTNLERAQSPNRSNRKPLKK